MDRNVQSGADMFLRHMSNAPMATLHSVNNDVELFLNFSL